MTDLFLALADHLAAQGYLPTEQWQPIKTAPRGGQKILLTDGVEVNTGVYISKKEKWLTCPHGYDCDAPYFAEGMGDPTHWMPLPKPPCLSKTAENEKQNDLSLKCEEHEPIEGLDEALRRVDEWDIPLTCRLEDSEMIHEAAKRYNQLTKG